MKQGKTTYLSIPICKSKYFQGKNQLNQQEK